MCSQRARLAAVTLVGALALAGCTGEQKATDVPTPTQSSIESPVTSPTESTSAATPTDSESEDPNVAYGLDLPAGVHLTPLGTRLKVGQTARIAWEPDKNTVGVLAVTVTRLRQGTLEDFAGFILDEAAKQSTPYYVDAQVENIGATDLTGVRTPLYLVDGNDVLVKPSRFQSTFAPCAALPLPQGFKAGVSTEACLVFLAADHGSLRAVSFRPKQEYDPIEWKGTVAEPTANSR